MSPPITETKPETKEDPSQPISKAPEAPSTAPGKAEPSATQVKAVKKEAEEPSQSTTSQEQNAEKNEPAAYRVIELSFPKQSSDDEAIHRKQGSTRRTIKATIAKTKFKKESTLADTKAYIVGGTTNTDDGSVAEQTMLLSEYKAIVADAEHEEKGADPIYIRREYAPPKTFKPPSEILAGDVFVIKVLQWEVGDGAVVKSSIHSKTLESKKIKAASLTLKALRALVPDMSSLSALHKFCTPSGTTVPDETMVFTDYLAMEPKGSGESSDPAADKAEAGIPTVKLFFKSTHERNNPPEIPDKIKANLTLKEHDAPIIKPFEEKERVSKIKDEDFKVTQGAATNYGASTLTENQWRTVLSNTSALYGWYIDRRTKQIMRAPKPAFQIRARRTIMKVPAVDKSDKQSDQEQDAEQGEDVHNNGHKENNKDAEVDELSDKDNAMSTQTVTSEAIIPNFKVNDDSKIDISVCSHEFEMSMARNDFSSTSTEASASGGFGGVSASISAGFASSKSSESKSTVNTFSSTMVARYMYPRCDLFFYPGDLEPTEDLKQALTQVRATLNINVLRKLHAQFGHLFCQKVTLGGRLTATKIMTDTKVTSEQSQKESFKVSVGASVSTPYGGGSFKHEQEKGSGSASATATSNKNEQQVFEAVGGDTLLANNPPEWAPTVGDHNFWRVINRDELIPLVDCLSAIDGYGGIKNVFIRAVPELDAYLTLNDEHTAIVRMKLLAPLNGLHALPRDQVTYYLGHRPSTAMTPRRNEVVQRYLMQWDQIELVKLYNLFNPGTYKAPALLGYIDNSVGGTAFGSAYNASFLETQWELIAPFDEALTHGSRVVIKTRRGDGKQAESHMVVFRNQQRVFLPAMSDNDELQYWRILINSPDAQQGKHIKQGDEIRLCWHFNDQTTGWRDYVDDVFGRRRNDAPADFAETTLFLKLPFPRFEMYKTETIPPAHGMIMAPVKQTDPQYYAIDILTKDGKKNERASYYKVQDVTFRIDPVPNMGYGDAEDYMLRVTQQSQQSFAGVRMTMPNRVFWF